jgi:hypothetical protein
LSERFLSSSDTRRQHNQNGNNAFITLLQETNGKEKKNKKISPSKSLLLTKHEIQESHALVLLFAAFPRRRFVVNEVKSPRNELHGELIASGKLPDVSPLPLQEESALIRRDEKGV